MPFKRTFVTHVIPKKLIEKLEVSPAANYFSYNLIDSGIFTKVFSLVPTNIIEVIRDNESKVELIQSRTFRHKGLFKVFNILQDNFTLFQKIEANMNVWFYNLSLHTLLSFLLVRYLKPKCKVYIIVLDFTPSQSFFSITKIIMKLINHKAHGIITLKETTDITNKNKLTVPGVVNTVKGQVVKSTNNKFLLSGILSANRNPKLILDAFSKFPDFELIITGIVEDKDLLYQYLQKYNNIKYLGLLEYNKYEEVLNSVTYCLNSRDPNFEENNYNFPSKVIEHLLYNKIIISTMEYKELDNINYFYVKPTADAFLDFLNNLSEISEDSLLSKYANQSNLVLEKFGISKWKESFELIENFNKKKI